MANLSQEFLDAALGSEGAKALKKAVEREPALGDVLVPRAIISWLSFTADHEYEGQIPGIDNSYVQFQKSEGGFSGSIGLESGVYSFNNASLYHLAASVAMALGVEPQPIEADVRDTVLVKLGQSIDTLAKAQVLMQELKSPSALKPQRMTSHGGYHVEHSGAGATPYSVIHSRTSSPVQQGITSLRDAQGIADWHQNRYHGYFSPGLGKAVLDPNAGYKISHEHHDLGDGEFLTKLSAHAPDGSYAGGALFTHQGGNLVPEGVQVDPAHRRRGLASAMYAHAQKVTGKTMVPSHDQTSMGQALWAGNKAKPQFGVAKIEPPGQTHQPTPQQGPQGAMTPAKQPKQAQPKLPSLSVGKSEAGQACEICGGHQFKDNRFVGCICFRDLAKSVRTTAYGDGYVLEFKPEMDAEGVRALMKTFGRHHG